MFIMKSDFKPIGNGEPNDPIIGDKAMKGRRWKIDWDASGKAYDKITKPTTPSKVLPYNKFYEIIQEVLSSTNASDVLNVDSKGCGASEFMKFFQIADAPERKTVEELLDTGDSNKILKAFQIVIDVLRAAGQLNLYKLEENTMKYKDFYENLNEAICPKCKVWLDTPGEKHDCGYQGDFDDIGRTGKGEGEDDGRDVDECCACGCDDSDKCNESSQCACDCGVVEESGKKKTTKKVVNPTNNGTFDNKKIEDLTKMKAALHKKNDAIEEKGQTIPHANKVVMSQINTAIRVKKKNLVKEGGDKLQWCGDCEQDKPVMDKSEIGEKDWTCTDCRNTALGGDMYQDRAGERVSDEPTGWDEGKINEDGLTVNKMDHTIDTDHTKNCDGARRNGSRISIG